MSGHAGSAALNVFQFNACDQNGLNPACAVRPNDRANAISASLIDFNAKVATFQEICRTTFAKVQANLGALGVDWTGYFKHTKLLNDNRCEEGGSPDYWGNAIFTRAQLSAVTHHLPPTQSDQNCGTGVSAPTVENCELRFMTCGNATIGSGFKTCTSHLENEPDVARQQLSELASGQLNPWAAAGAAVILGADLNINVRNCDEISFLEPIHSGSFGRGYTDDPYEVPACDLPDRAGTGRYWSADTKPPFGSTYFVEPFDELTYKSQETLDYGLFTPLRFNTSGFWADATSSHVSDHEPLRVFVTVHD